MRQYGEVPPVLSTIPAPTLSAVTGLGTGGGAGVFAPGNSGYGYIDVMAGADATTGGSLVMNFAGGVAPPTLFLSAPATFGTLTITNNATTAITVAWSGKPSSANPKHRITYEWAVSK